MTTTMLLPARDIAHRHRLRRTGHEWRGDCPACGYRDALALTERDGRVLAWCASCGDQSAVWHALGGAPAAPQHRPQRDAAPDARAAMAQRQARARALWDATMPCPGTIAARYLIARGVPQAAASPALRYHPECPHPSRVRLPAMLAAVTGPDGDIAALHRTYLRRDGNGKADIDPPRATLGPVTGGAVHLHDAAPEMCIGEGIETSAAAGALLGLPAWAALSAGNLARHMELPPFVKTVTISVDRDRNGTGERAAENATRRWQRQGRTVRHLLPEFIGEDAADVLARLMAHA